MATLGKKAASVEFRNVVKTYAPGRPPAVNDVSFTVEPGRLVTLLGPSGCGKTTLLRLVAGLEFVTSGKIVIGGADVTGLPATDRDVSMVFQSYALFPHMTVRQNVEYGLRHSGFARGEIGERADAGLKLVGLTGFDTRMPSQLSGGQQQRVAVARALVLEPQVLLFDEPLSNLDAKLRRRVREEIREIQTRLGLTVLYVTHDQEEALAVSDRIVVMNNAVVAQEGAPRELYDGPASAFVADFIGEANILECRIAAVRGGVADVRLGRTRLALPARAMRPGPAKLAVRPDRIVIGNAGAKNSLPGRVARATYLGSRIECRIETAAGDILVFFADAHRLPEQGARVGLTLAKSGPVLVSD